MRMCARTCAASTRANPVPDESARCGSDLGAQTTRDVKAGSVAENPARALFPSALSSPEGIKDSPRGKWISQPQWR